MDDDAATRRIVNQAKKPDLVKGDAAYCASRALADKDCFAGTSVVELVDYWRLFEVGRRDCHAHLTAHRPGCVRCVICHAPSEPQECVVSAGEAVRIG